MLLNKSRLFREALNKKVIPEDANEDAAARLDLGQDVSSEKQAEDPSASGNGDLLEVLRAARPDWSQKNTTAAATKLAQVDIATKDDLEKALRKGLNEKLRKAGQKTFNADTVRAMRACLGVELQRRSGNKVKGSAEMRTTSAADEASDFQSVATDGSKDTPRACENESEQESEGSEPQEDPDEDAISIPDLDALLARLDEEENEALEQEKKAKEQAQKLQKKEQEKKAAESAEVSTLQALQAECQDVGIPLSQLENMDRAHDLLMQIKRLEVKTMAELQALYRDYGFCCDFISKAQLVKSIKQVLIWENLKISHLTQVCISRTRSVERNQGRAELMKALADASWESAGIPVRRLASLKEANALLQSQRSLPSLTFDDLVRRCKNHGVPCELKPDKNALIARLRSAYLWKQLTVEELQKDCKAIGLSADVRGVPPAEQQEHLVNRLIQSMWTEVYKAMGIPVKRFSSKEVTQKVFAEMELLQDQSFFQLQQQYTKMGLPVAASRLDKDGLLKLVQDTVVWKNLPMSEIRAECQELKVDISDISESLNEPAARKEVVQRLSMQSMTSSLGIPAQRLGGYNKAFGVMRQLDWFEQLKPSDLLSEYCKIGLPAEEAASRSLMLKRLKMVIIWQALPLMELRKEYNNRPEVTEELNEYDKDDEQRAFIISRLLLRESLSAWEAQGFPIKRIDKHEDAMRMVQNYQYYYQMTSTKIKQAYLQMGFPEEPNLKKTDFLKRLKTWLIWDTLPLAELRIECKNQKLRADAEGDNPDDVRWQLMQRLLFNFYKDVYSRRDVPVHRLENFDVAVHVDKQFARIKAMSEKQLKDEYEEKGLPIGPDEGLPQLRSKLQECAIWEVLSVEELKNECKARSLDVKGVRVSDKEEDEIKNQYLDLLVFSLFQDVFESVGIPAKQLNRYDFCGAVWREWAEIEGCTHQQLTKRYLEMNIFEVEQVVHLRSNVLTERLKQVALWMIMPFAMLQKECRRIGVNSIAREAERNDLVVRLIVGSWAPREPTYVPVPPPPQRSAHAGNVHRPHEKGKAKGKGAQTYPIGKGRGQHPHMHPHMHWRHPQQGMPGMPGAFPKGGPYIRPPQPPGAGSVAPQMIPHLQTLSLPASARPDDVRKAYKKLALKYHPDKNPGALQDEAAKQFRAVTEAYQALCAHWKIK